MLNTETLVIGCGPAGSAAGISALKQGRDVLVVEARKHPRIKMCAGLLTQKSHRALKLLLEPEVYKTLLDSARMSTETYFGLWDGLKVAGEFPFATPTDLVDRPMFDAFLAQHYVQRGGQLIEEDALVDVDFGQHVATLKSGKTISYQRLIAADSANSRVRRLYEAYSGRSLVDAKRNTLCVEVNVDATDLEMSGVNILLNVVPRSYAWAFAKGAKVCLGLVKFPSENFNPNDAMRQLMRDLGVKNADKYQIRGAMLPFGNYMKVPAQGDALFFAGDAAGYVEPLTGEGIFYALQSGINAGEALDAQDYLQRQQYIAALIDKAKFYQRMLEVKALRNLMLRKCAAHPDFMSFFYDKHIDNGSLDSFIKTVREHKRRKRNAK